MRKSCRRTVVLARRNLTEILRDPLGAVFLLAMPLLMEILFYFLFHGLTSQFEMSVLAPGIVVFSQAFLTLFSGLLISLDRGTSFLRRLYVSEARPHEFICGYLLALLPVSLCQSILFFVVGGILDRSLWSTDIPAGVLAGAATSFFFVGCGILCGSLCGEKSIGGVSSAVIVGQSVLSGMWFPTEGLSGGFLTLMKVLPFKNATDLVRCAVNGCDDPVAGILRPLAVVAAYTIAVFVAATLVFRHKSRGG